MAANLFDSLSPKAKFFATLLTNAGFNAEELVTKNDATALRAHIDGLPKGGVNEIDLKAAIETATQEMRTQVTALEGKLTTAETTGAKFTALTASLDAAGVKLGTETDAAKVKAAVDLHSAKAARDMVAKAGHPGLLDDPAIDPAKNQVVDPSKKKTEGLTGRDRMASSFNEEIKALNGTSNRRRNN